MEAFGPPIFMFSTRLRFIADKNPIRLTEMIEGLSAKIEVKTIALGKDGKWYCWFTITDTDIEDYRSLAQEKKRAVK